MKIIYLAAGAAGMYCGSCLHDNTLAAALLGLGHDVLLVPTYTPLRTDEQDVSTPRLFLGGINVYLQQKFSLFRHTPQWLDALLDRPGLVRLASRLGPGVDAAKLGDLTLSMLAGEQGRQHKEVARLARWIAGERPDVVHLSNALLLGLAAPIRALGVPVVATLSGEDIFLDKLPEPFRREAQALLRLRARDASALVAMTRYYAQAMADYLALDAADIDVIPHGLNLEGHGARRAGGFDGVTIGYLARICPDKGLHQLIEALELLLDDADLPPLRLLAAGYLAPADAPYFADLQQRVAGWPARVGRSLRGELTRAEKIELLQSLDAFCLPTVYRESKGLSALEALANAVPVVLPAHGAFPELVADTGGGLLHEAGNAAALAAALRELIVDRARRDEFGRRGQAAIRDRYHAAHMAQRTLELYGRVRA